MANLAIFSTFWSFFPIFSKSMPLSHFFWYNPLHSVFLPMFMSINPKKKIVFLNFFPLIFMSGGQNHYFAQFGPIADPPCVTPPHPQVILLQQPELSPTTPKKALQKGIFFDFAIFQSWLMVFPFLTIWG